MPRILAILALSLLSLNSYSQSPVNGKISGTVKDSVTKAAVDFATVTLFKSGSQTPVTGMSTDPKGQFSLSNIPAGTYRLAVDFIGYKRKIIEPVIISSTVSVIKTGTIVVIPTSQQLQSVQITGKAPIVQNKIDKMVYNTENDLTAQGGVALDVLKKVPMISVDIDGNVELQGNPSVRFLINGKPSSIFGSSLTDALQSIPASQIKSIEVITSPGARYDANGTGGIINIVLKDNNVQGTNGSINLSTGTRVQNGSVNLNARKGKFGVGVFFSGNNQVSTTTRNSTDNLSYNQSRDTLNRLLQTGSTPAKRKSYQSGINFNWSISPKDELTATLGYDYFGNDATGITTQHQQTLLPAGRIISDLRSNRTSLSNFGAHSTDLSLGYKKAFKREGQELNLFYTSSYGTNINSATQRTDYLSTTIPAAGVNSHNPGKTHETEISLDYSHPITKTFVIETGGKVTIDNLSGSVVTDTLLNNGLYGTNNNQTYNFLYKRNIYAAYLSSTFSLFNNFLEGKAGLRYERTSGTTTNIPDISIPGYNILAPSFTVQHQIHDSQSIKFAYTYRIERPDYRDINPFLNVSDPHNISTGNPSLKPEKGQKFELGYNKTFTAGGNLYFAGFYQRNTEDIQGITTYFDLYSVNGTDYTNVYLSQRFNLGSQTTWGANVFGSVPLSSKLNLRGNIQFGERINRTPGITTVRGLNYKINLNASYDFGNNLIAEVFGNYNSTQRNILSNRPSFFFYNLAMRKQFLNKNASIGLTAANPFKKYVDQKTTSFGANFSSTNLRLVPTQSFGITLSYKFGKLAFKKNTKDADPVNPDLGN
jgi:ferric enterobactin receptor